MANVLSALAREKINLTALTVMDSHEHSVLRLVADDPAEARRGLKGLNIPFAEGDVMLVGLRNQPGALAHICEQLAGDHINIEYAYCSAGGKNGKTLGIFRVTNVEKALRALNESPAALRRRMGRRPIHTRNAQASST